MSTTKTVCVVGAGFSGIATSRVLTKFGYDVTVFDKTPDVGGVWSNYLSEMPMPDSYPAWPKGKQVQAYIESFVEKFDLKKVIQLNTEVINATQDEQSLQWTVTTRPANGEGFSVLDAPVSVHTFDVLIVANGTFSDNFIPNYPGMAAFREAGGKVCHTSEFLDAEEARGKDVVVVGYGKSACDCAVALSRVAGSTTVVARKLIWKLPKFISGLCYKYLFLGRVGENLFEYIRPGPVMRILHGPLKFVRNFMVGTVERIVEKQLDLKGVDARPPGHFEDIARASISLVSENFFESLREKKILLKRDTEIEELIVQETDGKQTTAVRLSDQTTIPAQIVCCGTGFYQRVPFLDADKVMKHCTDDKGNFLLYRLIKPIETENLYLIGYNSSLFCPTSFEVAALWVVASMEKMITLPSKEEQKKSAQAEFDWMLERTRGKHSHGTNVVPFSLHNIDDMLKDLQIGIGPWAAFMQWLLPVNPSRYRVLAEKMLKKRMTIKAKTE